MFSPMEDHAYEIRFPWADPTSTNGAEGVRCTQAYVAASVCSPSRAGLLTGRHPQRFGHEFNLPGAPEPDGTRPPRGLGLDETTLADALRAEGYRTGVVGKWHLGHTEPYRPPARGFEEFFGLWGGSRSYWALGSEARGDHRLREDDRPVDEVEGSYLTDVLADRAIRFVEEHAAEPFFLFLSLTAVHGPLHATEAALDELGPDAPADERRRTLAAMTASMDAAVARVVERIDALGLAEDTLVVLLNDNGGATNNASSNAPLRGHKGSKFEGGLRVPCFARWPGTLPAGTVYEHPVSALDVFPTLLSAAGGAPSAALDGVDLLPYWRGEREGRPHARLFWRRGVVAAVRDEDLKLIRVEGHPSLLFDLARDPEERRDRADERPDTVARLEALLVEWERDLAEPRWREAPRWSRRQVHWHTRPDERTAGAGR